MGTVCRLKAPVVLACLSILAFSTALAAEDTVRVAHAQPSADVPASAQAPAAVAGLAAVLRPMTSPSDPERDVLLKVAYGRTFGTSTALDYATMELSRRVSQYPVRTLLGPARGEVHFAVLASYVVYYQGSVERVKRLNFGDGYEIAGLPKGRFTFPEGPFGVAAYVESGAGMSYVSETYRNSGSRFNWSLLGGMGMERSLRGSGTICIGIQWRHLSNGNMWGVGDELHNSNSGTDMIQGLATLVHRF